MFYTQSVVRSPCSIVIAHQIQCLRDLIAEVGSITSRCFFKLAEIERIHLCEVALYLYIVAWHNNMTYDTVNIKAYCSVT